MKKYIVFFLFISFCGIAISQSDCETRYKRNYQRGIEAFNKKQYREAIEYFNHAQCPSLSGAQLNNLKEWIQKCVLMGNIQNQEIMVKKLVNRKSELLEQLDVWNKSPIGSLNIEKIKEQIADVDADIPVNNVKKYNTWVYIVANENYPNRNVPYALNDGQIFKEYCIKTLGVPEKQVKFCPDATINNIVDCVESMKDASRAFDGDINIVFYYAGHAFPDEDTKDAYLMPVDGTSRRVRTCYSLKDLYKELGEIKSRQVVCFLDACFSGTTREDDMLLTGRGVAIKPKEEVPQGNLVVFTSASGIETAHQYEEKQHGMFTYFLLKKMKESNGSTTLGEMFDYVSKNVKQTSYRENDKIQTPSVIPSIKMNEQWRNIKL